MDSIKSFDWLINPNLQDMKDTLKTDGIFVLKNLFNPSQVFVFNQEFEKIFSFHEDKIEILDKEDVSRDKRIFNAQNFSSVFRENFFNNQLFHHISRTYTSRIGDAKTLINLLEYSPTEVRNSGAGWHRDNHDCQFKVITYLTDTTLKNGNFQWITNSSKRHIGYPTPRTESYNTRFSDEVVEKEILSRPSCKLINILGKAGDVIFADTTYVHRGNIIQEGYRRAVTQYFF